VTGAASGPGTRTAGQRVARSLREISGVVVGGTLGALLWLIVVQEGPQRDLTEYDFAQQMGQVFVDRSADVAQAGLWGTILFGVLIACLYPLLFQRLEGRLTRLGAALAFAAVPYLLWGLVMAPGVTAYEDTIAGAAAVPIPGGAFASEAGWTPALLAIPAAILYALSVARCYGLMRTAAWWTPKFRHGPSAEALVDVIGDPSLELPEQVGEEGREGPRR